MRICAGITYMVLGEAPDMSSVDDEVRQHWNSLSIETARRKPMRQTHGCEEVGPHVSSCEAKVL